MNRMMLLTIGLCLATPALAQAPAPAPMPGMPMHQGMALPKAAPAATTPADTSMMDAMQKMQHDMAAAPMTGNPDIDFAAMMIPHHQGAVDMARIELRNGRDPAMRKLARDVIAAQEKEIAFMKSWLAKHPAKH
jgi:uncharacterized protein (DUF305 family)